MFNKEQGRTFGQWFIVLLNKIILIITFLYHGYVLMLIYMLSLRDIYTKQKNTNSLG